MLWLAISFLSGLLFALLVVLVVGHVFSRLTGQRSPMTLSYPTPQSMELPYYVRTEEEEAQIELDAIRKQARVNDSVEGLGQ